MIIQRHVVDVLKVQYKHEIPEQFCSFFSDMTSLGAITTISGLTPFVDFIS